MFLIYHIGWGNAAGGMCVKEPVGLETLASSVIYSRFLLWM